MSTNAPSDAAIVNIKGTNKALALKIDCNARYVNADPETGTAIAVSEAARNIVCSGGEPSAITNCLNFGNPYNPEVFWQFVGAIKGMSKACEKFKTPVTGGNVSFYNQSSYEGPVFPTPTIGMLGVLQNKDDRMTLDFKAAGDLIYLVGESRNDINSSEYVYSFHAIKSTPAPYFNLDEEFNVQQAVRKLIIAGVIQSAHDVSDGGLFITLLESSMPRNLGFDISTSEDIRKDAFLFGEGQSRVVVSVTKDNEDNFIKLLMRQNVEFSCLGEVIPKKKGQEGAEMIIDGESFGDVEKAKNVYDNSLGELLK